jgi:hypothetical protein
MAFCKPDFIIIKSNYFQNAQSQPQKKRTTHHALEDKKITISKNHNFVITDWGHFKI